MENIQICFKQSWDTKPRYTNADIENIQICFEQSWDTKPRYTDADMENIQTPDRPKLKINIFCAVH